MEKTEYKKIPNCLRKYRMARGFKQKEVAKLLGLKSASMVSRWEKGNSFPNSINLFKLAALYRTLVDALYIDLIRLLKQEQIKKENRNAEYWYMKAIVYSNKDESKKAIQFLRKAISLNPD